MAGIALLDLPNHNTDPPLINTIPSQNDPTPFHRIDHPDQVC